jgi:outer membrane biosynthesis protein TonB
VALATAPGRGWKSITFTGSAVFVELAMREALAHRLTVHAKGAEQAAILARLMAEKQGAMGAIAGPGPANAPADPILAPLAELDGLELDRPRQLAPHQPPETSPKTPMRPAPEAPPPAPQRMPAPQPATPAAPVTGVAPMFLNLRERLQDKRSRQGSTTDKRPGAPSAPPARPGPPGRGL